MLSEQGTNDFEFVSGPIWTGENDEHQAMFSSHLFLKNRVGDYS